VPFTAAAKIIKKSKKKIVVGKKSIIIKTYSNQTFPVCQQLQCQRSVYYSLLLMAVGVLKKSFVCLWVTFARLCACPDSRIITA
jgi:hypothetical protein